jgi:beta-N-acetylhexosaminidase
MPTRTVDPAATYAQHALDSMELREKVASLLMLHYPGTDAAALTDFVTRYQPGGLILMGDNIPAVEEQLPALLAAVSTNSDLPLITAIDQEGGIVRRIDSDQAQAASTLKFEDPEQSRVAFTDRSMLLERLGVDVNFGIVADQTADTASFIYPRALGTTAEGAAARVAAAVEGERGHVLSTLKHFPGHGAMPGDSHSSIPQSALTLDEWLTGHAVPFRAGIDAGAEMVMLGHLLFPAIDSEPASLSAVWNGILRDQLGFDGIIITDDMRMLQDSGNPDYSDAALNAVAALRAGATMLLYVLPTNPQAIGADPDRIIDTITEAVLGGTIEESTIDDAALRLLTVRRELSGETSAWHK